MAKSSYSKTLPLVHLVALVKAALAVFGRLPPPAARTDILARLDGTGAGLAADAWVAPVVELVVGHVVLADVVPHLLFGPGDEGVDLQELVLLVPLYGLHVLSGDALVAAQTANPGIESPEGTAEGLEFANLTAAVAALDGVVEEVDALLMHHALHLTIIREEHFDPDAVGQIGLVDELVGLWKEASCVEGEDTCVLVLTDNDVGQCLVFDGQRRGKGDAPLVCREEKADYLFGGRIAKALVQFLYKQDPVLGTQITYELCPFHISLVLIIPAPTVSLVSGSMNMTLPVMRFSR